MASVFIVSLNGAPHGRQKIKKCSINNHVHNHQRDEDDPHRLDAQIMAQNFINIVMQVFIAAHKEHDKEARVSAITNALMSLANIFKLIIRSGPINKKFTTQEELIDWLQEELKNAIFIEECEIALNKKARYLKITEKPSKH